jgi:hypothetical protein
MNTEMVVAVTTLVGVVLGGSVSFIAQGLAQRSEERMDTRRRHETLMEARRAERVAIIDRYLVCAQEAERVTFDHHNGGATDDNWLRSAHIAMDRLWVAEKMVRVLCSSILHDATHVFTNALNDAVWREPGDFDAYTFLAPSREDLLEAAARELETLAVVS